MGKRVYIISGAPGSGKSSYVSERATERDLVIDMDRIAQALRGDGILYGDNAAILDAMLDTRSALYKGIREGRGKWDKAYIITADRNAEKIARELKGQLIQMETSKEECLQWVRADDRRKDKALFERLIDEWYQGDTREQFARWMNGDQKNN